MGIVLPAEVLTGASHKNYRVMLGRGEELLHADVGFGEGGDIGDFVEMTIVIEGVAGFEVFEISENGAGMADQEGFIGVLTEGASDSGGGDEPMLLGEGEWFYWRIKINATGDETRVIRGIGRSGGLEAEVEKGECGDCEDADDSIAQGLRGPIQRICLF